MARGASFVKNGSVPKKRVLLVDDESDFVSLLTLELEAAGYEVVCAFDGEEGLSKALTVKPDVIVLDIMLPKMDGYDVCRKLKLDNDHKQIPIVMLTAKFQPNDISFGKDMGAEAYLTKPFESRLLLETIRSLLKK